MPVKPVVFGPFIKGLDSSTGVLTQPKGSFPRGSNLLLSKRGSLRTCDGSLLVNAFNGVATPGRGKAMCDFFFAPTGVAGYYLRVMKALDFPLGAPQNLTGVAQSGGNLAASTNYFYKVTAIDGLGGETTASNEVSVTTTGSNKKIQLTWNFVPNAFAYNVYRGTFSGTEIILVGSGLSVPQPSGTPLTVTFTDDGTATVGITITVVSAVITRVTHFPNFAYANFVLGGSAIPLQSSPTALYTPGSNSSFTGTWVVDSVTSSNTFTGHKFLGAFSVGDSTTGGAIIVSQAPPIVDTTQQTALYAMPPAANGISYTNDNLVALFPADSAGGNLDGGAGGGSGGGDGGGGSGGGQQGSTPAGGIPGNVSFIPQVVQFTNQAFIALGNGFPPQCYSDPNGTPTNAATIVAITAISVDAFGVVTVTTASGHKIDTTKGIGANVKIAGVTNPLYNMVGTTIALPSATSLKVVNLASIGQASSSGGTLTVTTIPVFSNFVPAYPQWTASVAYAVNSIVVPTASNQHYYKAVQGGTSGGSQPTFPTGTGARVADGSVIWQEAGLINTAAPSPPGCAHICVYAGSLWMFNTAPSNTANGLDGPTSLRMSDVNNGFSWNPINQAFLDKDDGQEGLGLATFTIAAQGIPPEGSLVALKKTNLYQIVGVFGSLNFAIQRAQTNMGTIAPRTVQFIPGFGIGRLTHLGVAIFDGVNDRVISTQIEPYLVGSNDPDDADIQVIDQQWQAVSQSALTANPPMYIMAIPVGTPGSSNGALTRILCFDMVLKAWSAPVDLPFSISTLLYVATVSTIVITLMGSFDNGTLQRWQGGDTTWATTGLSPSWSLKTPTVAAKDAYERLYCRRTVIIGQQTPQAPSTMAAVVDVGGVSQPLQSIAMPASGDFQVQGSVQQTGRRFDAVFSGTGMVTIDAVAFDISPRPVGVMAGAIA